jgi:hypothetical protein
MVRKLTRKSGRVEKKAEALRSRLYLEKLEDRVVPAGTWTKLSNLAPSPDGIGTMMLLSDGTVMGEGGGVDKTWYKLTPDSTGSYVSGTWATRASMSVQRLYFGSNVLPDGRVFVVGGEYSSDGGFSRTGEIYNPVTNSWSNIANFPQSAFGDDPTEVLTPGGDILGGYVSGPQTYIYHTSTNTWTQTGTKLRNDQSDEEAWVKLPDGSILSYDVFSSSATLSHAQRYVPSTGTWVDAGNVPVYLTGSNVGFELGPNFLLPDGRVFQLGANNHTAFYTPSTNTWVAGPDIPNNLGADDAPGAVLTNGKILFAADRPLFNGPTSIFEFDPTTNTYTNVTPASSIISMTGPSYICRMLALPNGQVLLTNSGPQQLLAVYTPDGTINSAWKPTISSVTDNGDGSFTLTGTQLNGISEGANYGDDAEMSSNYPLVRLVDSTGHVFYARTFNWDNTGVATGSTVETVKFVVPTGVDVNTATITVVANGIASDGFVLTLGVTDVTPTSAALSLDQVRVTFNRAVQVSSFTPDQAVLTDTSGATIPVTVDVVAGSGDTQFDLSFATQTTFGNYSLTIGPNILDTTGKPMDMAYSTTLSIVGPMIIADSGITHGQSYLPGALDTVTEQVTFNEPIDPATFTPDQVVFYGNNNVFQASSVTAADNTNTKFNIAFNADATDQYTMAVGPNIMDTFGNTAALYTAVSFNVLGPKIDATTATGITPGASYQPGALDTVTEQVTFNEAMDPNSFTPDTVVISGASGYSYNALSVTPADSTNTKFNIKFVADFTDKWTMAIGPNIYDGFGNAMDQNGNFVTGEVPGDQFTVPFNVLGPKVTASTLMGDFTNDIISTVRVTFSEAMDPTTFTPGQVTFTGPGNVTIPVTAINPVAGTNNMQFDVSFAPQGTIGNYTMTVGPNIFDTFSNAMDQNGNFVTGEVPGDQYTTPFTVVGPRVLSTQPLPGTTGEPVNALRVTFNKPIDVTTFTPAKIASFGGPGGPIGVTGIFAVPNTNFTQFDITFQPQTTTGSTQSLRVDDGTSEESFNNSAGSETEDNWVANSFKAGAAGDTVTSVSFQIGQATYTNRAITVLLYTGSSLTNPHAGSGLTLISQTDTTFSGTNGNLVTIPLATPVTLPPNQVYWVALLLRGVPSNQFPFANDKDAPAGRSWFDVGPTQGGAYNVNDTSRATVLGGTHPVVGAGVQSAGNLILHVNTVGTAYHMVLGPDIRDLAGNQMDQNQNLISGEIPADQYLATFNLQGLRITTPANAGHLLPGVNHVRLTFNEPVNPLTFTASTLLTLTGPGGPIDLSDATVSAVPFTNNTQFDVTFDPQTTTGAYTLVVAPTIQDLYGNKLDQNNNGIPGEVPGDNYTYTFGVSGLRVLSSTPSGATLGPVDHVRLTFNEAVDATTFDTTSIDSFTGPSGDIAVTGVTAVDSTNTVFDVTFAPQSALGNYTMVIGPNIQDIYGNKMDQNDNLIPGEVPGDQYTANFTKLILRNGDFETGDFTGWTQSGDTSFTSVITGTADGTRIHSGTHAAEFGPSALGFLSQTLGTTAGASYTLTFWLSHPYTGDTGTEWLVRVGGNTLMDVTNAGNFNYTQFTFTFTATSANTVLQFGFKEPPEFFFLDDVTVTDVTSPGAGPSALGGGQDHGGGSPAAGGGQSLGGGSGLGTGSGQGPAGPSGRGTGSGSQGGGLPPGAARRPNGGNRKLSAAGIGLGSTTGSGTATLGNSDGAILVGTLGGQQTIVAPAPTGSATWSATASLGAIPPFMGTAVGPQTALLSANGATSGHEAASLGALDAAFAGALDSAAVFDNLA